MRLLIIDTDDTPISPRFLLGFKEEGFLVDETKNWQKGIWLAKTNFYDLVIITDNQFEKTFSQIKILAKECPKTFLLVFFDALSLKEKICLLEEGADEVCNCFLPFREIIIKVRILLRREKSSSWSEKTFVEVDNLLLYPETFQVFRGGKEIYLRRKEFDLLYFLMRNQNRVITKIDLIESVWDVNTDFLTNTLEVHILNLRKKIDGTFSQSKKLIHTIYGRGYLFGIRPSFLLSTPAIALSCSKN